MAPSTVCWPFDELEPVLWASGYCSANTYKSILCRTFRMISPDEHLLLEGESLGIIFHLVRLLGVNGDPKLEERNYYMNGELSERD